MLIDETETTEAVTELSDGIEVTEVVTEDSELRVYISELNEHSAVIESGILFSALFFSKGLISYDRDVYRNARKR